MTWKKIIEADKARGYNRIPRCRQLLNNGEQCKGRPEARWAENKVKQGYCRRHRQERNYVSPPTDSTTTTDI